MRWTHRCLSRSRESATSRWKSSSTTWIKLACKACTYTSWWDSWQATQTSLRLCAGAALSLMLQWPCSSAWKIMQSRMSKTTSRHLLHKFSSLSPSSELKTRYWSNRTRWVLSCSSSFFWRTHHTKRTWWFLCSTWVTSCCGFFYSLTATRASKCFQDYTLTKHRCWFSAAHTFLSLTNGSASSKPSSMTKASRPKSCSN